MIKVVITSILAPLIIGCASPSASVQDYQQKFHPDHLVGTWSCNIKHSQSEDEVTVDLIAEWTEDIRPDGQFIVHSGAIKITTGDDFASFSMEGKGHWHAYKNTFTSDFDTADIQPITSNELTRLLDSDDHIKRFKKSGRENYLIKNGVMIRSGNQEAPNTKLTCMSV